MRSMIDPSADAIWDAVVIEVTTQGTSTTQPETDADWSALRRHAVILVESTNLLLMEGRSVAEPGSRSEIPGVDLEPEKIQSLLADDPETWSAFVGELYESGMEVRAAIESLDVDALLEAGDRLDLACESCHARYWYPGYGSRPEAIGTR